MFDHIVKHEPKRSNRIPLHHHGIVFIIIMIVLSTVSAIMATLTIRSNRTIVAQEPASALWLISDPEPKEIVAPLVRFPLATFAFDIKEPFVEVRKFSLILDGVYDVTQLQGISLVIDNAQVGNPVFPQIDGSVAFELEQVRLTRGTHEVSVAVSAPELQEGSLFQIRIEPNVHLDIVDPQREKTVLMLWPFETSVYTVMANGRIGAFVRHEENASPVRKSVALYIEGEDARLSEIRLSSDSDLTGVRADIFSDADFIASGTFAGTEATVRLNEPVLRLLRTKNLKVTVLLSDLPNELVDSGARLYLTEAQAMGYSSKKPILFTGSLEL